MLDGNGDPVLAFLDAASATLYFVSWSRATLGWNSPKTVDTVESVVTDGNLKQVSIARDPGTNLVGIAYIKGTGVWLATSADGAFLYPKLIGVVAGSWAGLAGLSVLEINRPNLNAFHILIWHEGVLVIGSLGGALAGATVESIQRWRRERYFSSTFSSFVLPAGKLRSV